MIWLKKQNINNKKEITSSNYVQFENLGKVTQGVNIVEWPEQREYGLERYKKCSRFSSAAK